jgi:hypothetical protein
LAISQDLNQHLQQFIEWKKAVDQPVKSESVLFVGGRGKLTAQGLQRIWKAVEPVYCFRN